MGRTSTEVKRRYNDKVYRQLNVRIPIELYERFYGACEASGLPIRQAVISMIEEFLNSERPMTDD